MAVMGGGDDDEDEREHRLSQGKSPARSARDTGTASGGQRQGQPVHEVTLPVVICAVFEAISLVVRRVKPRMGRPAASRRRI